MSDLEGGCACGKVRFWITRSAWRPRHDGVPRVPQMPPPGGPPRT